MLAVITFYSVFMDNNALAVGHNRNIYRITTDDICHIRWRIWQYLYMPAILKVSFGDISKQLMALKSYLNDMHQIYQSY